MPFLVIDGVTVPVKDGSARRKITRKGRTSRSILGVMRDGGRNGRLSISSETVCLDNAESLAVMNLILGYGHVGSFDGELNLSSSANPDVGGGAHLAIGQGWSGDALAVRSGSSISWSLQLGDEWTVFVRRRDATSGIWQRLVLRSDGQQWLNEVNSIAGVANCMTVASGAVTLRGATLANVSEESLYDELVALPWFCPDSILTQISACEQTHSPMPLVKAHGDVLEYPIGMIARGFISDAATVQRGQMRSARNFTVHTQDKNWINNGVDLSFGLDEDRAQTSAANSTTAPAIYMPLNSRTRAANFSTVRDVVAATANASRIGTGAIAATGPANEIDGAISLASTHYNLADSAAMSSAAGAAGVFTAMIWLRPTVTSGQFYGKDDGTLREWNLTMAAGVCSMRVYGNAAGTIYKTYTFTAPALALNTWNCICVSFANNSGTPTILSQLNGEPCTQTLITTGAYSAIQDTAAPLAFGDVGLAAGSAAPVAGSYAHVCYFSSALTHAQMRRAYLTTKRMMNVRRA